MAIVSFGSASTLTGRPIDSLTIWATIGIRDVPPTSNTLLTSSVEMPAEAIVRCSAFTVSATRGRTICSSSSRVSRTSVCTPGNDTAMVASVSFDSASLARRQSSRNRAWPATTCGSEPSADDTSPPSAVST